ncbi:hypothetical protein OUZ56_007675 [Daphnia magna]|uniref:Uncharacterized protein n=1 Tax=Daphnia magna TaxID=35525 RepID=A0ABR0AAP8_9CRUS|nr:hypothetical protein OUZ56_007675 [Daphnia magna]
MTGTATPVDALKRNWVVRRLKTADKLGSLTKKDMEDENKQNKNPTNEENKKRAKRNGCKRNDKEDQKDRGAISKNSRRRSGIAIHPLAAGRVLLLPRDSAAAIKPHQRCKV